jgi:hypothetical protein
MACKPDGSGYGGCEGDTTPHVEICGGSADTNCDGFLCGDTRWAQVLSTVGNDTGGAVAVDGSGNIYVAGSFTGPMKIGGTTVVGFGGEDVFVAKLDSHGAVLWVDQFGDTTDQSARAIAVDASGNVVVTGSTSGPIDFGGGPIEGLTYVVKLDASGKHVWSISCGGSQPPATYGVGGVGIALDAAGDVVVTGTFGGTAVAAPRPPFWT